jgi:hypothetical protein
MKHPMKMKMKFGGAKKGAKGKGSMPKALSGKLAQSDTMADQPTMGNPRMKKARDKRLEKAAV